MSIRLAVTLIAAPGKGRELAQVYKTICAERAREPGCEQYEIFQGVGNPDRLVLLERWADQAALDAHAKLMATAPHVPEGLRIGSEREDYEYNRTR
jgi:quinol monooxygenase YgiN